MLPQRTFCEVRYAEHLTYPPLYRWLAASLGQLGHTDEAERSLRGAIEISKVSFDFFVHSPPPWMNRNDFEHQLDGLRKAGWLG